MPGPTALLARPVEFAEAQNVPLPQDGDEDLLIGNDATAPSTTDISQSRGESEAAMHLDEETRPHFQPEKVEKTSHIVQSRRVPIPPHRMSLLKKIWQDSFLPPLVDHLNLDVRMQIKSRIVEMRTSSHTMDTGALQKGEDFVRAFALGFDAMDAIALLRMDDLFIETFEVKDVKSLQGDHLARAIGRIAGHQGKTKYAIENASKTRIVLADQKIHILGGFKQIHIAREAVVSLILGTPPRKVYGNLRTVASRMKQRF